MFFNYDIKILEIENSTICNARCPQCTRQAKGDDTSWFEHSYLKTVALEKIPQYIYDKLEYIVFEGTMGDPCAAPNLIQSIELVKQRAPHAEISVVTNGGLKNTQFWRRLANALAEHGYVVFAIDGLEETNYIYRVGVDWKKLDSNIQAYIEQGGRAQWQYIVFRHNEHQLESAKLYAKELGFEKFYARKTSRFIYEKMLNFPNSGAGGVKLEPPQNEEHIHASMKQDTSNLTIDNILEYNLDKNIFCDAKNKQGIYLDYRGRLFPCCFISGTTYLYENMPVNDGFYDIWKKYKDSISLYNKSWEEIVASDFYSEVETSWKSSKKESVIFPCVSTCSQSCTKTNDPNELGRNQIIIKSSM